MPMAAGAREAAAVVQPEVPAGGTGRPTLRLDGCGCASAPRNCGVSSITLKAEWVCQS